MLLVGRRDYVIKFMFPCTHQNPDHERGKVGVVVGDGVITFMFTCTQRIVTYLILLLTSRPAKKSKVHLHTSAPRTLLPSLRAKHLLKFS